MMRSLSVICMLALASNTAWAQSSLGTGILGTPGATVSRESGSSALTLGSDLSDGDQISTGTNAFAGFYFVNSRGPIVYVGPSSRLSLGTGGTDFGVMLYNGEVRVTASNSHPVQIATPHGDIIVNRGIARVMTSSQGTRAIAEEGDVVAGTDDLQPLPVGKVTTFGADVGPVNWTIDPMRLQLIAASQLSQLYKGNFGQTPDPSMNMPQQMAQSYQQPQQTTQQDSTDTTSNVNGFQTQATTGPSSNIGVGNGGTSGIGALAFGGGGSDAGQSTGDGILSIRDANGVITPVDPETPFNGFIHAVIAERVTTVQGVNLLPGELGGADSRYFSVATGLDINPRVVKDDNSTQSFRSPATALAVPGTGLVTVDFGDLSNEPANDGFGQDPLLYSQPGDPGFVADDNNDALNGIIGELGGDPPGSFTTNPSFDFGVLDIGDGINDPGVQFNDKLSYFFGQFRFTRNDRGQLEVALRRSDQDRLILPGPTPSDPMADNPVVPNDSVDFVEINNQKFPTSYTNAPVRLRDLPRSLQAAFTVGAADSLHDFSRRTGQTRFVIDGQIIDITGYQRPKP